MLMFWPTMFQYQTAADPGFAETVAPYASSSITAGSLMPSICAVDMLELSFAFTELPTDDTIVRSAYGLAEASNDDDGVVVL